MGCVRRGPGVWLRKVHRASDGRIKNWNLKFHGHPTWRDPLEIPLIEYLDLNCPRVIKHGVVENPPAIFR